MKNLLFIIFLFTSFLARAQKQIEPEKLKEDFDALVQELKFQHQGLYEYYNKSYVDQQLDSIRNTLTQPLTKLEFYKTLTYTLTLTNEGHTAIYLPKKEMLKIGISKSIFPLIAKIYDHELIITQNYGKEIDGLKKGAKLLSINGNKVSDIVDAFLPLIITDGFNQTSKYEWMGGLNFSLLYRLVYGKSNKFTIEVQDFGSDEIQTFSIPAIRYTRFKSKNAVFEAKEFDFNNFEFEQINDSVAYLSVPSFGDDDLNYENWYEESFKKIDSLKINHLIIDVQANGGGTEGNENLLFSYLTEDNIQKYKKVTMLPKPYLKNRHKEGYIEDKWALNTSKDSIAERGNYTLFSQYYSDLGYKKPNPDYIYKANVYVLTNGVTFSGGAEFSSLVKMTDRAIFIGEETGGAYEGNVSGYSEWVTLPNSKIEIKIPTVHFQINVSPELKGRGVIPDYEVAQTWEDYINTINSKKRFTLRLIKHKVD